MDIGNNRNWKMGVSRQACNTLKPSSRKSLLRLPCLVRSMTKYSYHPWVASRALSRTFPASKSTCCLRSLVPTAHPGQRRQWRPISMSSHWKAFFEPRPVVNRSVYELNMLCGKFQAFCSLSPSKHNLLNKNKKTKSNKQKPKTQPN